MPQNTTAFKKDGTGILLNATGKSSTLALIAVASFSAVSAGGIASATYTSSTGIIALTFSAAPLGASVGQTANGYQITIGGLTGTGVAPLNGTWPITSTGSSGTVVSVQGPIGLGTLTITTTTGTLAAGGGAVTAVVKAAAGRVVRLAINQLATAGSWVLYDSSSASNVTPANTIWSAAYGAGGVVAGSVIPFDWPVNNGIVLTVPVGGIASISYV